MDRIENQSINDSKRLSISDELSFIKLNGEKRKVTDFLFLNQDVQIKVAKSLKEY